MSLCNLFAIALVFAEIAYCLGQKTVTPKGCDNRPAVKIITGSNTRVNCGANPFPPFMPQRCRIFKKDFKDELTTKVKVTLDAGESSVLRGVRCEYSKVPGQLGLLDRATGTEKASIEFSGCALLSKPAWIDDGEYGFYCDKNPYPPVIPVSCDFGRPLGVIDAGETDGNTEEKVACDFNFKEHRLHRTGKR